MTKQHHHGIYFVLSIIIFMGIIFWGVKYCNLNWVEVDTSCAKVTVNFLFPMEQNALKEHIYLIGARQDETNFQYTIKWINQYVAELRLKEQNKIKGQKIKLMIQNAPSKFKGVVKSECIPIQFKTDIELIEPKGPLLIASTHAFTVAFNTPIALQQVKKYLKCEADFKIESYKQVSTNGEVIQDDTKFLLTPTVPLENGKHYQVFIKSGMRSKAGMTLRETQSISFEVDQKPRIIKTYPIDGDKWIGLYPHMTLETKEEIIKAEAQLNGKLLNGKLVDSKHAFFIVDGLLKPDTQYQLTFQVQGASGEMSEVKQIQFTTTTIKQNRFWLDIHMGNPKQIKCYEGTKCVRTIYYQTTQKPNKHLFGTYYLQGKAEVYEDHVNQLGGNYWMIISDKLGIQGTLRDTYWQPSDRISKAKNFIISDEDAAWLYNKMKPETMIIIRN